jgi:hypothetical protein
MTPGRLVVLWLHVLAASLWVGGLVYASHLVVPRIRRGERALLPLLLRARVVSWAAMILLVLTGFENLRHVPLDRPWVMAKVLLVLLLIPLAAHRDFALVPGVAQSLDAGSAPGPATARLRRLDWLVTLLSAVVLLLGVTIARGVPLG